MNERPKITGPGSAADRVDEMERALRETAEYNARSDSTRLGRVLVQSSAEKAFVEALSSHRPKGSKIVIAIEDAS